MAQNRQRNQHEKDFADEVTREEFNRLKRRVDDHDDRLNKSEERMEDMNRTLTQIRLDVSPIGQQIQNLIQKIEFREERLKGQYDGLKKALDDHKQATQSQFDEQKENISKLEVPDKTRNIFRFWTTSEGIMVALITGGVTVISILIEVIMK